MAEETTTETTPTLPEVEANPGGWLDSLEAHAKGLLEADLASDSKVEAKPEEIQTKAPEAKIVEAPKLTASKKLLEAQRLQREMKRAKEQPREQQQEQSYTLEQLKLMAKQDPWAFLNKVGGVDPNYLSQFTLNNNQVPTDTQVDLVRRELQQEIQNLRAEQSRAAEERELQSVKSQVQDYKNAVNRMLKEPTNADKFELFLSITDAPEERVWEMITEDYNDQVANGVAEPKMMSPEAAAQIFEEDLQAHFAKLASAKKAKSLLGTSGKETKGNSIPTGKGVAPLKQETSQAEGSLDPLEEAARRYLGSMEGSGGPEGRQNDYRSAVTITQSHMQQVPDRNSDSVEQDLLEKARQELKLGIL